jgi:hypothetical protein
MSHVTILWKATKGFLERHACLLLPLLLLLPTDDASSAANAIMLPRRRREKLWELKFLAKSSKDAFFPISSISPSTPYAAGASATF